MIARQLLELLSRTSLWIDCCFCSQSQLRPKAGNNGGQEILLVMVVKVDGTFCD